MCVWDGPCNFVDMWFIEHVVAYANQAKKQNLCCRPAVAVGL